MDDELNKIKIWKGKSKKNPWNKKFLDLDQDSRRNQ